MRQQYTRILFFICLYLFVAGSISAQEKVLQRIIIIGDAGRLYRDKSIVPDAAAKIIDKDDINTTVVFAGDNVYSYGLPDEDDRNYKSLADVLTKQLKPFYGYKAKVYVVPGNHDWQKSGPQGWERIKRQGKFVTDLQQPNISFLPKDGCPGPEEIHLGDSVVMIIMDTQWWLQPYEKPGVESDCPCKTQDEVTARLHDIAYRNRDKKIIFISHQPMRSHGVHGGYYTWKEHIFPFTALKKNLYIPLPVLGSIYPVVRGGFGNVQDLKHPVYRQMVTSIEQALAIAPDVTFAGGHDHTLQLIHDKGRSYIVSGSGINRERVKKAANTLFASSSWGFAAIEYLSGGQQVIRFYEVDENETAHEVYASRSEEPHRAEVPVAAKESTATGKDSVTAVIAPEYNDAGSVHRFFLGEGYRKIWATPVRMKVFHIQQENGGMTILQKGGGKQTKSLRMKDPSGKEWVLRTVQKNPALALPEGLRETVAKEIVQDQISAANPYAPLTVPVLADVLGVPHAHPQIVYVPDDPALGIYREDFAGSVCVYEEREPGAEDDKKTYTSFKLLDKLEEDNDNIIDERAVLKARMLDLLIADWDRHEDQWRWIKKSSDDVDVFSPVPRDRDQVYFMNSGLIAAVAARKWLQPKFQGFKPHVRDVNGAMFNGRYFDRFFLVQLSEHDWKEVIADVQHLVTDDVIEKAVKQLPDTIYAQCGKMTIDNLKARRNELMKDGLKYYRFLAKTVSITGSDKKELFEVHHEDDGSVTVDVYKFKKEKAGRRLYHRQFYPAETKELRLYGRGGDDVFAVTGSEKSPIKVRMIGGGGDDSFYVNKDIRNKAKLVVYDQSDKDNVFPASSLASVHASENNSINSYNGRSFKYDILMPLGTIGYNLDDGILFGLGLKYTTHGFRKEPFSSEQKIMVGHALATDASFIRYNGIFKRLVGKNDLDISFNAKAPDNVSNFFGEGNETEFIRKGDNAIRYYRTRYNVFRLQANLVRPVSKAVNFFGGVEGEYFKMKQDENEGRFINVFQAEHTDRDLFAEKTYAGLNAGFEINTRNDSTMPTRGFYWRTSYTVLKQLNGENDAVGQFYTDMRFLISFRMDPRFVIANRIGGGFISGQPEFFQLLYLGGKENLSGYRSYRFAGTAMIFHNIELRAKLFDFNSYLFPGTVGLTAFNDIGRVWVSGEHSAVWHDGYGAGFYVTPAKLLLINASIGFSDEGVYPYFRIGYRF
ncbi:BamA/TamA family outer membrane protein [Chitinophagaceae bacterium MMS25-I14]